ncbi:MAG TPA: nitrilase-related carbon-nitrogen hydrolase [Steroidobacteraceae bacterium]|nr:nitrilase-related carbon-nitrogen hydrolase [Steroidobacteraceae bacterium]
MSHPQYEAKELERDEISLCVVQSRVRAVDVRNLESTRTANLEHMLGLIDAANGWLGPKDLVMFHEFPITGFDARWRREELLKVAIEIPGVETEAIAARAKRYGCYVVFGSYARDPAWPNHILSITTVIDRAGQIVGRHWKARNIKGLFGGAFEIFTTTIFDVLDQYVEMYGADEVVPVTRTPIGNICTTSTQLEPEIIRAFALKGGEIMLRTATGGFDEYDIRANARYNQMYTAIANNAISPGNPGSFDDISSGGSAIYGPDGAQIAKANSPAEGPVLARIPIRAFRARRKLPNIHPSLYRDLYANYVEAFPPNLYAHYQPTDGRDAARYLGDRSLWKK